MQALCAGDSVMNFHSWTCNCQKKGDTCTEVCHYYNSLGWTDIPTSFLSVVTLGVYWAFTQKYVYNYYRLDYIKGFDKCHTKYNSVTSYDGWRKLTE